MPDFLCSSLVERLTDGPQADLCEEQIAAGLQKTGVSSVRLVLFLNVVAFFK